MNDGMFNPTDDISFLQIGRLPSGELWKGSVTENILATDKGTLQFALTPGEL